MDQKVINYPEYWGGKKLAYPNVPADQGKFSRSVAVGNLIFVSGCQGANDESLKVETDVFEEQMVLALQKVRRAMEEAGSSMNNVIKTLILIKNIKDYPKMRRTELEYYQKYAPFLVENPPASTVMEVGLGKPEYLIEIEVTGVISRE
jgi:2-iminobutanoate/2-iminopropanoate deaminase